MKYGFVVPMGDWRKIGQFASEAEEAGWDGIFVAHCVWGADAWISLTVAAMHTKRIRLGTMLTPISCTKPWQLASEIATLDSYSNGRVILTIGMGAPDTGFAGYGEATDLRTRAELVDESLDIIEKLQMGETFVYQGKHYQLDLTEYEGWMPPVPTQSPLPIWAVGAWPRPKSMNRVLRCNGIVPAVKHKDETGRPATLEDVKEIKAWIQAQMTTDESFDIVIEGETPEDDSAKTHAIYDSWSEAGATWWIESMWGTQSAGAWWHRMRQGPFADRG